MNKLDHFSKEGDKVYAGNHVIVDFWGANNLTDVELMELAMREAVEVAKAHLLHIHIHPFTGGGVTGVAALSESHISVHTWPELNYAAFDVFMCGDSEPLAAVDVLEKYFNPSSIDLRVVKRGLKNINEINGICC